MNKVTFRGDPLLHIRDEKHIEDIVNFLIENGAAGRKGGKLWKDCLSHLYTALIAYLWTEAAGGERNIPMMIEMLEHSRVPFVGGISAVDIIFEDFAAALGMQDCLAVTQYHRFKSMVGVKRNVVILSAVYQLTAFAVKERII